MVSVGRDNLENFLSAKFSYANTSSLSLRRTIAICAAVGLSSPGGLSGEEDNKREEEENVHMAANM
jgi:hypothetical protein